MKRKPKFSMIIGTMNREQCLRTCLYSFIKQEYTNFEIVIVDQSENGNTHDMLLAPIFSVMDIKYIHMNEKGLSKARNTALKNCSGDYFCLCDDDAQYSPKYLMAAANYLQGAQDIILSGIMYNLQSKSYLPDYFTAKNKEIMSIRQIFRMAPSAGLIFPMSLVSQIGYFDTNFGVGAKYGACEETDYVLRALDMGLKVVYLKDMYFEHPTGKREYALSLDEMKKRVKSYSCGLGALVTKYDGKYRKNVKLIYFEKKMKLVIKRIGFLGERKKTLALAEHEGLTEGLKEYRRQKCESVT